MGENRVRVAYLAGTYPLVTHSFILTELAGLRELGVEIHSYAVRPGGSEHSSVKDVAQEAERTQYLLPTGAGELLGAHLSLLWDSPRRYMEALSLAWTSFHGGWKPALYQVFYFAEAGLLARDLQRQRLPHLHTHFGSSTTTVAMLAARLAGISFSFTLHGPNIFFEPYRWALGVKMHCASFVVCISQFCRSQAMLLSARQDWDKLRIVRCGVDTEVKSRQPDGPACRLIYVGRLLLTKGLSIFLQSLSQIRREHPTVHLTLIGEGPDRSQLEELAAQLELSEALDFAGYQDYSQVGEQLSRCDILVLPSFAEGVSIAVMEAMARELAVICTPVGGMTELVEHGVDGWMIPPGQVDSLTAALRQLISDPELRARLGSKASAKVRALFDRRRSARELRDLYLATAHGEEGGAASSFVSSP